MTAKKAWSKEETRIKSSKILALLGMSLPGLEQRGYPRGSSDTFTPAVQREGVTGSILLHPKEVDEFFDIYTEGVIDASVHRRTLVRSRENMTVLYWYIVRDNDDTATWSYSNGGGGSPYEIGGILEIKWKPPVLPSTGPVTRFSPDTTEVTYYYGISVAQALDIRMIIESDLSEAS